MVFIAQVLCFFNPSNENVRRLRRLTRNDEKRRLILHRHANYGHGKDRFLYGD